MSRDIRLQDDPSPPSVASVLAQGQLSRLCEDSVPARQQQRGISWGRGCYKYF